MRCVPSGEPIMAPPPKPMMARPVASPGRSGVRIRRIGQRTQHLQPGLPSDRGQVPWLPPIFHSAVSNQVSSTDTDLFSTTGSFLGPSNASSTQTYKSSDTLGHCYGRKLVSASNKLTEVDDVSCH